MSTNTINLAVRFILEMSTLVLTAMWGWKQTDSWPKFILVVAIPLTLAAVWGTFAVPNDPSRLGSAPVVTPGFIRLAIELLFFSSAIYVSYDMDWNKLGLSMTIIVLAHYIISYDRVIWLLQR